MKKIYALLILISITASTNAQITEGNWLVGGNLSFINSNSKTTFNNQVQKTGGSKFDMQTNLGYFLVDKFVLGLTPSFNYTFFKNDPNTYSFLIGPFVRYYFLKSDNLINFFSHVEYQYGNYYSEGNKLAYNSNFSVKAGPSVFFNNSVAIEFTVEYQQLNFRTKSNPQTTIQDSNLIFSIGFQIHLIK
ncbi:outer membrane beta-barrel protein [Psychroflexus salis]|uniref:Outer membrane protein beta-barrel domain-containing protein n=1 Tax=Psychroflexus salis TaxID=1526574 RepID=A0A916ZTM0_9FLAO|nr:outer membrane beta-barrel protein [Psychroflexus salis]GGE13623.1 hypothetical protein GCM10010831_13720 [Psychroflexus salis]